MVSVILVGGGSGKRFGNTNIPKQFTKIAGKEIIDYSIEKFINHNNVDELIIVSHEDWVDHLSKKYPNLKIIPGGLTRSQSVIKGLSKLSSQSKKVLIHDAARPLINTETITICINTLEDYDCVAPIINIRESIVQIDKEHYDYINRNKIKIVQTPQCFRINVIKELYKTSIDSSDEISLALKSDKNYTIKLISGSEKNIKITTKSDLDLTKILLKKYES